MEPGNARRERNRTAKKPSQHHSRLRWPTLVKEAALGWTEAQQRRSTDVSRGFQGRRNCSKLSRPIFIGMQ
jgi:hypothetical protein